MIAPIGTAWRNCKTSKPEVSLLLDDRHPTDEGTYLAACVLYDVIYQKRSAALRLDLDGPDLARETKNARWTEKSVSRSKYPSPPMNSSHEMTKSPRAVMGPVRKFIYFRDVNGKN